MLLKAEVQTPGSFSHQLRTKLENHSHRRGSELSSSTRSASKQILLKNRSKIYTTFTILPFAISQLLHLKQAQYLISSGLRPSEPADNLRLRSFLACTACEAWGAAGRQPHLALCAGSQVEEPNVMLWLVLPRE